MPHLIDPAAFDAAVRHIVRAELERPALVHQRDVERIVGIPGRQFLRDAHEGRFPSTKERRLILARTADVVAYYAERIAAAQAPSLNEFDAETIEFARVGARRVAQ
jgi:hypothetical protein